MTTLDGAHQFHLDVLPPAQAIRLLGKLSGNARLDSEPGATEDLARQCDYLPLALRIAGARLAARLFRLLGLHRGTDVGVWTAAALLDSSSAIAEGALEQLVDAQLLETPTRRRQGGRPPYGGCSTATWRPGSSPNWRTTSGSTSRSVSWAPHFESRADSTVRSGSWSAADGIFIGFTIRPASQPHSITWGSPTPIKGTSPPRSIAWTRA